MVFIRLIFVSMALGIGACTKTPVVCTEEARPGIRLIVVDSATGAGLALATVAVARDNGFVDTLKKATDSVMFGAYERGGRYHIDVSRDYYLSWSIDGVEVAQGVCHVQTVTITARLVPPPPPNMRLKLAAPPSKGSLLFVNTQARRRSLSAIR
jgi:hypothetical protein